MKPEKPAQIQKHENNQRYLFLYKMCAKYDLKVLNSDIIVALLCIQQENYEELFDTKTLVKTEIVKYYIDNLYVSSSS